MDRTCENCKYNYHDIFAPCGECSFSDNDKFEPKEEVKMINEKIVPMSPYGFRFPTETEMAVDETLKLCGISGEDASMIAIEVMKKLGKSNEIPACCRGDRDAHTDNLRGGEESVDEIKLKPCPFCGGEAEINLVFGNFTVGCSSCHCTIIPFPYSDAPLDASVKAWNRRANDG